MHRIFHLWHLFPDPDVFTGTATDAPDSCRMAADPVCRHTLGVAYTMQFFAQRGLPASTASLLMSTESVFSLLAGFLILHQMLNGRELTGCVLMFAAIILVQIKGKEKESINS